MTKIIFFLLLIFQGWAALGDESTGSPWDYKLDDFYLQKWVVVNGPNLGEPVLFIDKGDFFTFNLGLAHLEHVQGSNFKLTYYFVNKKGSLGEKGKPAWKRLKPEDRLTCMVSITKSADASLSMTTLNSKVQACQFGVLLKQEHLPPSELPESPTVVSPNAPSTQ